MSAIWKRGRRKQQELLADLKKLAQDDGCELLETEWLGTMVKHRFRHIESGREHEWRPNKLFERGFPKGLHTDLQRSAELFLKLKKLKQLAQDNGYELLETEWMGTMVKHRFRHIESDREHEWRPQNLFNRGFPKGPRSDQKRSAELFLKLKQLAHDNGCELLETEWLGSLTKHRFRHIESGREHGWRPNKLFERGFPKGLHTDLQRSTELFLKLKQLTQDSGFELLETEWLGTMVKHRFRHIESGREHEWRPHNLFNRGFPKGMRKGSGITRQLAAW